MIVILATRPPRTSATGPEAAPNLLLRAIDSNDEEQVDQLLASGVDPNTSVNGRSALQHAVLGDSGSIVKRLLAAGVDPNQADQRGTPLQLAAEFGRYAALDALLEGGADPNQCRPNQATALTAVLSQRAPVRYVHSLLKHGADANLVGPDKRTPLETACWVGTSEAVDALLALGVRFGSRDQWNALYWAVSNNRIDNIECLLRHGVDPDVIGPEGRTVLQRFISSEGRTRAMSRLIEAGADPERRYPDGRTPMNVAEAVKNREVVELLTRYRDRRSNDRKGGQ
jgi:ankyrin repeat protein